VGDCFGLLIGLPKGALHSNSPPPTLPTLTALCAPEQQLHALRRERLRLQREAAAEVGRTRRLRRAITAAEALRREGDEAEERRRQARVAQPPLDVPPPMVSGGADCSTSYI